MKCTTHIFCSLAPCWRNSALIMFWRHRRQTHQRDLQCDGGVFNPSAGSLGSQSQREQRIDMWLANVEHNRLMLGRRSCCSLHVESRLVSRNSPIWFGKGAAALLRFHWEVPLLKCDRRRCFLRSPRSPFHAVYLQGCFQGTTKHWR